jgi:hypothetical protein
MAGSAEKAADPKAEPFATPQAAAATEAPQLFANPTLQFDGRLGLLVIEFHDTSGKITTSIPSQRQLEAYRMHEQPLPNQKAGTPPATTLSIGGQVPDATKTAATPAATTYSAAATYVPATHGATQVATTTPAEPHGTDTVSSAAKT